MTESAHYEIHPACSTFPLMQGDAYLELVESIRKYGLLEPITLCEVEGKKLVLDGRNRLIACEEIGIMPRYCDYSGDDPIGFAISKNLHRRHLTVGQRAAIAATIKPMYEEEAKKRQVEGQRKGGGDRKSSAARERSAPNSGGSDSTMLSPRSHANEATTQAAKAVGVGKEAVRQYEKVERAAPELAEKVKAGKVSLNAAVTTVEERKEVGATPGSSEFFLQLRKKVTAFKKAATKLEDDLEDIISDVNSVPARTEEDRETYRQCTNMVAELIHFCDRFRTKCELV